MTTITRSTFNDSITALKFIKSDAVVQGVHFQVNEYTDGNTGTLVKWTDFLYTMLDKNFTTNVFYYPETIRIVILFSGRHKTTVHSSIQQHWDFSFKIKSR